MTDPQPVRRYRFGAFEADASAGELRRQGVRVRLNAQPFQVLLLLLERPGEVLTREEIAHELWSDGTIVDYEHGVNSAVNRLREALGDTASSPRFVETLARRGYRFLAPVERIVFSDRRAEEEEEPGADVAIPTALEDKPAHAGTAQEKSEVATGTTILSTPQELPTTSPAVAQTLFVLLQLMYASFYVGALANLSEIEQLLSILARANLVVNTITVTAAILIPVRAFVLAAVLFHAPRVEEKLLRIWPLLLIFDELWALSPFLLLHHINFGLALACTALLIYSPFAQRSLILMGAGAARQVSAIAR